MSVHTISLERAARHTFSTLLTITVAVAVDAGLNRCGQLLDDHGSRRSQT